MFDDNGGAVFKERKEPLSGPGIGTYGEHPIDHSTDPFCINEIAFSHQACGNCGEWNVIQKSNLQCENQYEIQNTEPYLPYLADCWESKNGGMCRNCKNEWNKEENYYDPMRRGFCRKVINKCPDGEGFFKPTSDDVFLQRMCITCPVNCKSCYGSNTLCVEKWPGN